MTPFEAKTAMARKLLVEDRCDDDFKTGTIEQINGDLAQVAWNDGTKEMCNIRDLQDGRQAHEKKADTLYEQPLTVTLTVSDWVTIELTLRDARRGLEKDWPASAENIEHITDRLVLQTKAATTAADAEASKAIQRKYGSPK